MKNSLTIILILLLFTICFSACRSNNDLPVNSELNNSSNINNSQNKDEQNTNITSKLTEITSNGQIPYDNLHRNCVEHGLKTTDIDLFPFYYSSKHGFADANGNVKISEQYDDIMLFSEGKSFVKSNDEWIIIDTNGNELYKVPKTYSKSLSSSQNNGFKNGKAICICTYSSSSNYKIGVLVINSDLSTSEIIIPTNENLQYKIINTPEFAGILTYNNYVEYDTDGIHKDKIACRLFDLSGNKIWEIETLYETFAPKLEQFEYKKALSPTYSLHILDSINVENGYMNAFDENFKWGLINVATGELVLDYKYDYVGTYSDELCNVCSYGKWGYVDLNGNQSIDFVYKYTEKFVNGNALVIIEDNSFCVIDKTGNVCFDCGISFNRPRGTQCQYQIYTDLQEKNIILIWNYYGDEYYLINIGDTTLTIDEGSFVSTASPNYVFVNKRMFSIV